MSGSTGSSSTQAAIARTLPLLSEGGGAIAVPFVCRYRLDVVKPLDSSQVYQLADFLRRHQSLESLRKKILPHVTDDDVIKFRVETSISKSELDHIYAPYRPPSKGSLEEQIAAEHPNLVHAVNELWNNGRTKGRLKPADPAVTLLANRIASDPAVMDTCISYLERFGRVKVIKASKKAEDEDDTYETYYDFSAALSRIANHQVLAIRRGIDQKVLSLSYEIDGEKAEHVIRQALQQRDCHPSLWKSAIHDAWTRLLRKRCTTRLWKGRCQRADDQAISVFCDNLTKALLAPPTPLPAVLVLDPGYKAGIKCAMLDADGQLIDRPDALSTVKFMENEQAGIGKLTELLEAVKDSRTESEVVTVIVGNGHGTKEARDLVSSAAKQSGIAVKVQLVNEAGASVWSVTPSAQKEFPSQPASAIAAVSIGRRYLNPLAELVKIPPKSLGLGMYQHDLTEKRLEEKLHLTAVDAVAEVGVDGNACSAEILEKVPSLTTALAKRIMGARPIKSRNDILSIKGIGPKTFERCVAFIRIYGGKEPLDETMCHPESYDVAKFLLAELGWKLDDPSSINIASKDKLQQVLTKAAGKYCLPKDRVSVIKDHLRSSILRLDPREKSREPQSAAALSELVNGCSELPNNLLEVSSLQVACPCRDILGTVRNVLDFGVFVDYGGECDALVHRSKLGNVQLSSLLVGQEIGIDILGVASNGKVAASIRGLGLPAESLDDLKRNGKKRSALQQDNRRKAARRE